MDEQTHKIDSGRCQRDHLGTLLLLKYSTPMKEISPQEASQALGDIRETQNRVIAQGPHEYVPFIGWGLFVLVGYPPFDFVSGNVWGPALSVLWIVGMLITYRYFRDKAARVHILTTTPWYVWVTLGVLTSAAAAFAEITQSRVHFAWSIAGLLLAIPYIGYGLKLRAAGK